MKIELYNGDCLEIMKNIPDKSIDCILCDLPYGTTKCNWDNVIPFNDYVSISNSKGNVIVQYEKEYIYNAVSKGMTYEVAKEYFDRNKKYGMWHYLNKLIKPNGAIVLFGSEPFSSALRMSNISNIKKS